MPITVMLFLLGMSLGVGLLAVVIIDRKTVARRKAEVAAAEDPIRELAERVRRAFEAIAQKENISSNLGGLCGRAAVQFCLAAKEIGINARLVHGNGHAYSLLPDDRLVDVTATQFTHHWPGDDGYAPVEIGPRLSDRYGDWWREYQAWDSVEEWLEKSNEPLYGARHSWKKDKEIVEATA